LQVSIGVTFNMDFLFVHIHISAHVGASLRIEGPEFGGVAHVDFYLFGFDVYFGATIGIPDPIALLEFWNVVHKPGTQEDPAKQSDPNAAPPKVTDPQMANIGFALEDGAFPMPQRDNKAGDTAVPNAGQGSEWHVKGGSFQFRIATDFAVSAAYVRMPPTKDGIEAASNTSIPTITTPPDPTLPVGVFVLPIDTTQPSGFKDLKPVYSKPMQTDQAITSNLTFGIKDEHDNYIDNLQIFYVRKQVPASVWGQYSVKGDPNHGSSSDVLGGDKTVELAMGLSIHSPPPKLSMSKMPAFNATEFAKLEIPMGTHRDANQTLVVDHWLLPATEPDQTAPLPLALDSAEEKKASDDQWADSQILWLGAANSNVVEGKGGMLDLCGNVLGWTPTTPLVGDLPKVLIGTGTGTKEEKALGLPEYYLALPRVSAGV
jgi:hypothetical protein